MVPDLPIINNGNRTVPETIEVGTHSELHAGRFGRNIIGYLQLTESLTSTLCCVKFLVPELDTDSSQSHAPTLLRVHLLQTEWIL